MAATQTYIRRYIRRLFTFVLLSGCLLAPAANFSSVHYDAETDELVATLIYRGTHPSHRFSLDWGECKKLDSEDVPYQIAAQVLDSHWRDAARQEFEKTERFSLENLQCRPAEVTLRTASGFYATVKVPAKPNDPHGPFPQEGS